MDDKDDVDNEGDGDEGEKVKSVRRLAALKEDDEQDFDRDLENDLTAALI